MATRKAGDSLLKAAYQAALAKEGRTSGELGTDGDALHALLSNAGSAALDLSDLRAILNDAASPRKTAEMKAAEKLGLIETYLQDSFPGIAPMVLPVQDRAGVYGASVIDGDRLIVHGLTGPGGGGDLAFAPAAASGLVHVIEAAPVAGETLAKYAGTLSDVTARKLYAAAQDAKYARVDGALEDWQMDGSISAETGPEVQSLLRQIQRSQTEGSQGPSAAPFQIVASRGPGAQYDVLGMRGNGQTMATVNTPGEPGWLGNPYVASDAGGRYSRQEATDMFARLVEEKAQDPVWRQAFMDLQGRRVGYYKPDEKAIHLHALQEWITRNTGA